jgi:PadR family transcriptional regulator, regulatory protein PadR
MVPAVQLTILMLRVLEQFLSDPLQPRYGLELMKATGLQSGTLYPILARFERVGWVTSQRESIDPKTAGRPARRYYVMTPEGVTSARLAKAELLEQLHVATPAIVAGGLRPGSQPS